MAATVTDILRVVFATLNAFVCVYAFVSAGRMMYGGSALGRVTLGCYTFAVGVAQATLLGTPFTARTALMWFATTVGVIWFLGELWLAQRRENPVTGG